MHLIYHVPSDTVDELCKILKSMLEKEDQIIPQGKKKNGTVQPIPDQRLSEFTLRESIQTLKGIEVMADNKCNNIELIPNNNNCLYELRFKMTVKEGFPPKNKSYAVILKFEAVVLNADYDDITIGVRMDNKTKMVSLTLFLPREYLVPYRKREKFEGKTPIETEYLAERKK